MEFTEELDKKISAVLLRTGIKPHYKGYRMLKDAIKLVMHDPSMIAAQSKKLYPTLGKMHGDKASAIERAIRFSLSMAADEDKLRELNNLYGFEVCETENISNGEYLALVAELLLNDIG